MKKYIFGLIIGLSTLSFAFASYPSGFSIATTTYLTTDGTAPMGLMCYNYGCGYNAPQDSLVVFDTSSGAIVSHELCATHNSNYPGYYDCYFDVPTYAGTFKVAFMSNYNAYSSHTYSSFHSLYLSGSEQYTDPWVEYTITVSAGGVSGCTSLTATNYNYLATIDDGSCYYSCLDSQATNYNATSSSSSFSCTYPVAGCTNPVANNYNPNVVFDDGSCTFSGCMDSTATNYNFTALTSDGSCRYSASHTFNYTAYDDTFATSSVFYRASVSSGTAYPITITSDGSSTPYWAVPSGQSLYITHSFSPSSVLYMYSLAESGSHKVYDSYSGGRYLNQYPYNNPTFIRNITVNGTTIGLYQTALVTDYAPSIGHVMPTVGLEVSGKVYGVWLATSTPSFTTASGMRSFLNSLSNVNIATLPIVAKKDSYGASIDNSFVSVPATVSSVPFFLNAPSLTSTSTIAFTSPSVTLGNNQGGVVQVVHDVGYFPDVYWGINKMTRETSGNSSLSGVTTDIYYTNKLLSATTTITVMGVTSGTVDYIHASVWDNGDAVATFDTYQFDNSTNRAWLSVGGSIAPVTVVGSIVTGLSLSRFSELKGTVAYPTATSSSNSFTPFDGQCSKSSAIDNCTVGYKIDWSIGSNPNGYVSGITLYHGSTVAIENAKNASSTTDTTIYGVGCFDNLFKFSILDGKFYSSFGDGLTCSAKGIFQWVINLFVPTPSEISTVSDKFTTGMQSGQVATSLFGFAFFLKDLSATSTTGGTVSLYNITVPSSISGGTFATTSFPITVNVGVVSSSTDSGIKNFLYPFFAVFGLFWFGFLFFKVIH